MGELDFTFRLRLSACLLSAEGAGRQERHYGPDRPFVAPLVGRSRVSGLVFVRLAAWVWAPLGGRGFRVVALL